MYSPIRANKGIRVWIREKGDGWGGRWGGALKKVRVYSANDFEFQFRSRIWMSDFIVVKVSEVVF